ncbi:hypothetical protein [uncultured Methanospirillum sp.]|nr:hypothetical protein [uncultured Methanospirillum sp.]
MTAPRRDNHLHHRLISLDGRKSDISSFPMGYQENAEVIYDPEVL